MFSLGKGIYTGSEYFVVVLLRFGLGFILLSGEGDF
jgi:hypothetical protein